MPFAKISSKSKHRLKSYVKKTCFRPFSKSRVTLVAFKFGNQLVIVFQVQECIPFGILMIRSLVSEKRPCQYSLTHTVYIFTTTGKKQVPISKQVHVAQRHKAIAYSGEYTTLLVKVDCPYDFGIAKQFKGASNTNLMQKIMQLKLQAKKGC